MNYRPIIESAYDRAKWQGLLHDIFGSRVEFYAPAHRLSLGKSLLKQAWFLGAITLSDGQKIGIYEGELADNVELERNRVSVRELFTTEWRGRGFVGAFQFCYKTGASEIRFSYVSETWTFDKEGQFRKESTDTRRFTYFLGAGHRSRTAIHQFEELKRSDLTLADITKAFSVEAVSARFFADYKRNYEDIVEYVTGKRMVKSAGKWQEKTTGEGDKTILAGFASFENPEKAIRDYVKKLMGRLVFLQFIQKKGWLGVPKGGNWGEGDREFLQHLFEGGASDSFIDDVLEPLFDDINTRRKGDLANHKLGKDILIPYLNGGLFEPDQADAAAFPLPADNLKALFDFFGSYNFTIDENDPTDAEVGVDPEMLSRIFENLLEDNKDKGAFYTPKTIVEYMCRESLTAYLQTEASPDGRARTPAAPQRNDLIANFVKTHDASALPPELRAELLQKLRDVKICDPAIGSGAFPMGLLKELFACRAALGDPLAEHPAVLKRAIIENNIYGVDIEKGAVDIARLRFWLALVVDEETPHALPNLDFKIMQGNSLLESFGGVPLDHVLEGGSAAIAQGVYKGGKKAGKKRSDYWQSAFAFDGQDAIKEIVRDKNALFNETDHEVKKLLISRINKNVKAFISSKLDPNSPFQSQIPDGQNDKFFLWHTWFNDVFTRPRRCGFDIVIGNPPYVKEYVCKTAFDGFRETSPYYQGKMDLWYGFACHGLDLLAPHGVLCFIAQNNWTTSAGASKMRSKIVNDSRIRQLVDFNCYMVFDDASIQTMVMLFERDSATDNYEFDLRMLTNDATRDDMLGALNKACVACVEYQKPVFRRERFRNALLIFSSADSLFEKIKHDKTYLSAKEIIQGIVPALDDYFIVSSREGFNALEQRYIKEYYTGLKARYVSYSVEKYLIYLSAKNFHHADLRDCPNFKSHFEEHRKELEESKKKYGTPNKPYYFVHRERNEEFFLAGREKIVSQIRCDHPRFYYTTEPFYGSRALFMIQSNRWNMRFLVGLLNSRLAEFWFGGKGKKQGALYKIDKDPLLQIPIPLVAESVQKPIVGFVDRILSAKKKDPNADTSALESQIDQLVYKLYGLTPEEIAVVEAAVKG